MVGNENLFPEERAVSKQRNLSPLVAEDGGCFNHIGNRDLHPYGEE